MNKLTRKNKQLILDAYNKTNNTSESIETSSFAILKGNQAPFYYAMTCEICCGEDWLKATTSKPQLKQFEIREGDGNQGCYRRGTIEAIDAFEALRLASRRGMINKPYDVKIADFECSCEDHCYAASHVAPIYGDACRWLAEAHIVTD